MSKGFKISDAGMKRIAKSVKGQQFWSVDKDVDELSYSNWGWLQQQLDAVSDRLLLIEEEGENLKDWEKSMLGLEDPDVLDIYKSKLEQAYELKVEREGEPSAGPDLVEEFLKGYDG